MGRRPREIEPDGIYHVISRGNNRGRTSLDAEDYDALLQLVARATGRYGWQVLAYCVMPNHYHLVVRVPHGGLSQGMCELNGGYARRTNLKYGRRDHLFRNRFLCIRIDSDEHLLVACRYAVLNPEEAGLCANPADWPASSYRATAGLEAPPAFLAVGEVWKLFDDDPERARRAYRDFVEAGRGRPKPLWLPDIVAEM